MKSAVFYYFTGSGNTLKAMNVVKTIFEKNGLHVDVHKIEESRHIEEIEQDILGLFFPVAIQSTYPIVWNFINDLPATENQKVFMLDTMEEFSGGVVGPVKKTLTAKGYDCIGAIELKMASSMQIKNVKSQSLENKNALALSEAQDYAKDLLLGRTRWSRIPILSDLMRGISKDRNIWTQTSKNLKIVEADCVQCGHCIRSCPVQALSLVDNKVTIDHSLCNVCMRCSHICPKDAFLYKNQSIIHVK